MSKDAIHSDVNVFVRCLTMMGFPKASSLMLYVERLSFEVGTEDRRKLLAASASFALEALMMNKRSTHLP